MYFCCCVEQEDNELLTLEIIHRYVELLDKYFGSVSSYYFLFDTKVSAEFSNLYNEFSLQVCELDIIFNFEKAYFMWDEFVIGGDVQETSKKNVLKAISDQDMIQEVIFSYFCFCLVL